MRKALLSISLVFIGLITMAQGKPVAATQTDILQLKEPSFDFGRIPQGKPVTHVFVIQNTGKEPLALENVQASCGCTTPEWNKEAIAPGATAEIDHQRRLWRLGQLSQNIRHDLRRPRPIRVVDIGEAHEALDVGGFVSR